MVICDLRTQVWGAPSRFGKSGTCEPAVGARVESEKPYPVRDSGLVFVVSLETVGLRETPNGQHRAQAIWYGLEKNQDTNQDPK